MTRFVRRRRFLAAARLVETIVHVVSKFYDVPEDAIRGPRVDRGPSHARKICMFITRGATGVSYAEIGRPFNNRTRRTVIDAIKDVEAWIVRDPQLRFDLLEIASSVAARWTPAQIASPIAVPLIALQAPILDAASDPRR